MLEQVTTETLQEKAYIAIKDSIMRNDLLPGQRLSIDELARDLGVSPTPVREALTRLSADGLVERARNKTACVAEITEDDVHQTYEVRKLLEPYAVSVVAKKIKSDSALKDDLQELKRKIEEIQELATDTSLSPSQYEEYLQIDLRLDEVVLKALQNSLLRKVFALVNGHSRRVRSFTEAISKPREAKIIGMNNEEHLAIIKALIDGDSERTKKAVQQHLDNAGDRTARAVSGHIESELITQITLKEGPVVKGRVYWRR